MAVRLGVADRFRCGGGLVAWADVDATLPPRALQDALKAAIADRGVYVGWKVDHPGWVVELLRPEREPSYGRTLEGALAWSLNRLMRGALTGAIAG